MRTWRSRSRIADTCSRPGGSSYKARRTSSCSTRTCERPTLAVEAATLAERCRHRFRIFERQIYINSCSQVALSDSVRTAYEQCVDDWDEKGAAWEYWVERQEAARSACADLVNAGPDEIAVTTSLSAGVSALASGLRFARRSKVVLTDWEFPTIGQIWHAQESRGARVAHVAAAPDGTIPLDHFERVIDDDAVIVSITHVCYRNGGMIDVPAVVQLAHERGALVLLDAFQSVGSLPVDVQELGVDFLGAGVLKYLLGSAGLGFFYCRRDLVGRVWPTQTGWFADENIFAMDHTDYSPAATAARFQSGTPPVPSIYAGIAGIRLMQEIGIAENRGHALQGEPGLTLNSLGGAPPFRARTVVLRSSGNGDAGQSSPPSHPTHGSNRRLRDHGADLDGLARRHPQRRHRRQSLRPTLGRERGRTLVPATRRAARSEAFGARGGREVVAAHFGGPVRARLRALRAQHEVGAAACRAAEPCRAAAARRPAAHPRGSSDVSRAPGVRASVDRRRAARRPSRRSLARGCPAAASTAPDAGGAAAADRAAAAGRADGSHRTAADERLRLGSHDFRGRPDGCQGARLRGRCRHAPRSRFLLRPCGQPRLDRARHADRLRCARVWARLRRRDLAAASLRDDLLRARCGRRRDRGRVHDPARSGLAVRHGLEAR